MFKVWLESSVGELYQSAVDAFPHTTARQHLVGDIDISQIRFTPFLGVRTLFTKCLATNEDRQYHPIILFKGVNYNPEANGIRIMADGRHYELQKLSLENSQVLVRCQCLDEFWRFRHYNKLDRSLYGVDRKPYAGQGLWEANPTHSPGICKHIMKFGMMLHAGGLLV